MSATPKTALRFRERAELLDFLLEVSAATSETLDLDRLLENVAGVVKEVVPYDLLAILLYSEKLKALRIRYSIGHREEIVKKLVVPLGEGITGAAASQREPVVVGDVRNDPRYLNALDAVRSELAVPMMARGRLVGVIDLQSTRLNTYGHYERAMLRLIASRVAAAIDNARLHRRVERQNRTLRTLARVSQEFSSILDLDELLRRIGDSVRALIPSDSFNILLLDERNKVLRHRFSLRVDERGQLDNIPLGTGITGNAAASRQPIRVHDTLADPRYLPFHADIRSEVAMPLALRGRVIGVMDLESERVGFFTEDHVRTLSLLAPQIASSIENARLYQESAERERRMEADLHAARDVQAVLLPRRPPAVEGLESGAGLLPARSISGDLYDFFTGDGKNTIIALGDVSGKGAAAALYGALVSGLLRTMAPQSCEPGLLLKSLNEALIGRKVDARFVTLLVMVWDPLTRKLRMANAGGFPPLICRAGEIIQHRVEGVPLGLLDAREYDEVSFQTRPGDVIALYSDGVVDQTNLSGEDYGRRRLSSLLKKHWKEPAQSIVDAILIGVDHFAAGAETTDDETVVVLKVTE